MKDNPNKLGQKNICYCYYYTNDLFVHGSESMKVTIKITSDVMKLTRISIKAKHNTFLRYSVLYYKTKCLKGKSVFLSIRVKEAFIEANRKMLKAHCVAF